MHAMFSRRVIGFSNLTKSLSKSTLPPQSRHHHDPFTSLPRPSHSRLLPSASSSSQASRFDPSLLWRSVSTRGFLLKPFGNAPLSLKLGNLGESRVGFFGSQFRRNGFGHGGFSGFQRRGWLQGLSPNQVVSGLIIANVGVFMMWRIFDKRFMVQNFMISLDNFTSGRLHTLITSAFSHIDAGHIISNMIGLYFFGTSIARTFGPQYLLKLYLAGALGGSVFFLIHQTFMAPSSKGGGAFTKDPSRAPALGASGAVNAIMLLDIMLHPTATLYIEFIFPVPAMLLGIFLIGKDVLRIIEGDSHISGSAHLGGAAVAAIAWARIRRGRYRF
ncbi:PREDICTED: RHOMBOID-like protein 12, mitochondrial [Tarenaya hassleriana]|uniref:RHOMBOID-like protein 12, mitochondrial n=1 Tax=Tarenaya hassleriana TaxID=28532 RepID=UPI00053C9D86|nr:PREDICTED: RHOMBOID-like protein 12, mitochondrial [Tarenaya hassleriana]